MPFDDMQDFTDVNDLIAPLPDTILKTTLGKIIWDPTAYDFIVTGSDAPGLGGTPASGANPNWSTPAVSSR
ncbi:MAG: hypothetical protein R2838_20635 [Caldilineaceae bacterium]